ncbi:MAG: L,D-transpeptidase family protein [Motiliproteus sp.]
MRSVAGFLSLMVLFVGMSVSAQAQQMAGANVAVMSLMPVPVNRYAAPENIENRQNFQSLGEAAFFFLRLMNDRRWKPIADGPLLRPGDDHPQVLELRRLLSLYGDLPFSVISESDFFGQPLQQALMRFQRRHGIKVDGIMGPKTRAMLNITPRHRAFQIALNIERQQQFKGRNKQRYIQVNIPEYQLRYFDDGAEVLAMKTIIGRRTRPTPLFESKIRSLVVNPSWSVPKSIAYKDILPHWAADQDYLKKKNLKIVSGWQDPRQPIEEGQADKSQLYRGKEYLRFWQPPGEGNALGRVKFDFPNTHSVYLHDTPSRGLFDETERALSSGCVRLEKPLLLARTLLASTVADPGAKLAAELEKSDTIYLRLEPVPIYTTYWTAWLDERRVLHFSDDVYRRDRVELSQNLL